MRRVFVDFPQPVIFTRFTFAAERKLPWPSVREEILHRRQHAPRFEETDAHPLLCKDKGSRSTACARPDHHYVIAFFAHGPSQDRRHSLRFKNPDNAPSVRKPLQQCILYTASPLELQYACPLLYCKLQRNIGNGRGRAGKTVAVMAALA